MKCILGLLVLLTVSAWTEAMVSPTAEAFARVFVSLQQHIQLDLTRLSVN